MPIEELLADLLRLRDQGWILELVATSQPEGTTAGLPIIALRTPAQGPALWLLSGIHGEEPAGPNALAEAVDTLAALGREVPIVLLPLCNPQGYARGWRYLNMPRYDETVEGQSVGDSCHLLPAAEDPGRPRCEQASSPEAAALTLYLVGLKRDYPPFASVDLHEDDKLPAGYVYSQGALGAADPFARAAVAALSANGVALQRTGKTRFGEEIENGIVASTADSSIDELIACREILVAKGREPGPGARTAIVLETPAEAMALSQRKAAHLAFLRALPGLVAQLRAGAE
jgi:predicted deacylase